MATSMMMMYPAFETQHEQLPHQHYLNQYYMQQQQQQQQRLSPVDATATATMLAVPTVPEALRCQYSSKRCEHHRTNKKSGGLHKFCAVHREKANRNQMRLDHRRRVLKRLAQRSANGTPSSPSASSTSTISSPYTKKKRTTSRDGDDMLSIEDDLEIDLMPLALHRENNPHASASSELRFDPQDLHILETLLFSDDDASERKGQSTASATNKPLQRKKQKTTHTVVKTEDVSDSADAFGSWLLHL